MSSILWSMRLPFLLLLASLGGSAATILPTSYSFTPASDASYPDTGGTELTDNILATGVVNNYNPDGVPYVAWLNQGPVTITFTFSQSYQFNTVEVGALRSDLYNFAGLPSLVTIGGQNFNPASNAIPDNTRGFLAFNPVALITNSLTISLTPQTSRWLMLDEIRFDGVAPTVNPPTGPGPAPIPEPSTALLVAVPVAATILRARMRQRS